ncbi:hypothetical protein TNIN_321341 [Trichonephila inaurata madagascariensis]|uniref:Endonuclease/exonuclease/phosphatase domain-containing protein n=1 Tax=Trichonephila inaurata madagascariensis TaxID=2747483 RepID=A0A8X7C6G3_9ARAC|nr:hypothetical protein TNIN_321341 [Trichonephila inaurata madagascariensis]
MLPQPSALFPALQVIRKTANENRNRNSNENKQNATPRVILGLTFAQVLNPNKSQQMAALEMPPSASKNDQNPFNKQRKIETTNATKTKQVSLDIPKLSLKLHQTTPPTAHDAGLSIFSWNADGVRSRIVEMRDFVDKHSPDILLIQETHLRPEHSFKIPNYNCYRTDRTTQPWQGWNCAPTQKTVSPITMFPPHLLTGALRRHLIPPTP